MPLVNPSSVLTKSSSSQTSFAQKFIEIDVQLGPDPQTNQPRQFDNGSNAVTIKAPHRVSVRVQNVGAIVGSTCQVSVYGMVPTLMDQLSTLGLAFQLVPQNTITVRAGDSSSALATAFIGTVRSATPDFNQVPDVPFVFDCFSGYINAVAATAPSSFSGPVDVAATMNSIANQMGYGFENNGVTNKLPPSYFPGTAADQYKKVAEDAGIQVALVPGATGGLILAIWPKGKSRGTTVPLISPGTGLIGYPAYTAYGILVKSIYNPSISFGGQINVQSSLKRATGTWVILRQDHALDCLVKDGLWESSMWCFNPNYPLPAAPAV